VSSAARVWTAFAALSLAWGSSYLFIRFGLRQLTPLSLVAMRLAIGAATILILLLALRRTIAVPRRSLPTLAILATINTTAPFLLISWGEVTVPSGLASVLNSTVPIFSVILAGLLLHDEPVNLMRVLGVVVGFVGVVTLLSRDLSHGGIVWSGVAGQAAIVLASICYAAGAVYTRRNLRGIPSLSIAAWVLLISAAETAILSLIFSPPPLGSLHPLSLLAATWLGALGSGLAYVLSFFILANWGAARYTLVAYMLPVTGLTLGVIVLGEHVDWHIGVGSILVIGGIVLASMRQTWPAPRLAPAAESHDSANMREAQPN
jgi:drug/metabolite transporter (DMT)-like permease